MGYKPTFESGNWKAICDRCGFIFKADALKHEWNGLIVCSRCYEARHPLDFLEGIPDNQTPPWTRPEAPDNYISEVTRNNTNGTFNQLFISTPDSSVVGTDANVALSSSGDNGTIQPQAQDYGAGIGEMIVGDPSLDNGFIVR